MGKSPTILFNMGVDVINNWENYVVVGNYIDRVVKAGGIPMLIPPVENDEVIETLLDMADGVVFVGGRDYDPADYGAEVDPRTVMNRLHPHFDIAFGKAVMKREMPVLGVCAGCQLLNIITGGKLIQHLANAPEHQNGVTHTAEIIADGFFARSLGKKPGDTITVNSYHHQAADPAALGKGLVITARGFDGTVEAIELPGSRMALGVQFHPERMGDLAPAIFGMLIEEAKKFRRR